MFSELKKEVREMRVKEEAGDDLEGGKRKSRMKLQGKTSKKQKRIDE